MSGQSAETDCRLTKALGRVNAAERLIRERGDVTSIAVADWLRTAGADLWAHGPLCCFDGCDACDDSLWMPHARRALALADVVLPPASETPEEA